MNNNFLSPVMDISSLTCKRESRFQIEKKKVNYCVLEQTWSIFDSVQNQIDRI